MQKKKEHVKRRHNIIVKLLTFFIGPFFKWRVGYKQKRIKILKSDQPFILISNHVQWLDPILTSLTFGEQIYYLATEHMFNDTFKSKLIKYAFNPIPKSKNKLDFTALKKIINVINEGGNVGVFIEGDSTMNGAASKIAPGIGKLALKLKVPIILFTFDYSYLKKPRWAKQKRKGTFSGEVVDVLHYEDYKDVSATKLSDYIERKIAVSVYDLPPKRFKGKNKALGLEKVFFNCPHCEMKEHILTRDDLYICFNCGFQMIYDDFGYLHSEKWPHYKSVAELDEQHKENYQKKMMRSLSFSLSATGLVTYIIKRKQSKRGKATLFINQKALTLLFSKTKEEVTYLISELSTVTLAQKETVIIYLNDGQTVTVSLTKDTEAYAYEFIITAQVFINIYKYKSQNKKVITLDPFDLGI